MARGASVRLYGHPPGFGRGNGRPDPGMPRGQPLAAITPLAVVAALFGLGGWAFHDMYQFPFGWQLVVVPGPGGTVEL